MTTFAEQRSLTPGLDEATRRQFQLTNLAATTQLGELSLPDQRTRLEEFGALATTHAITDAAPQPQDIIPTVDAINGIK